MKNKYDTFFKHLKSYCITFGLHSGKNFEGYSLEKIKVLAGSFFDQLPEAYLSFQKIMGNSDRCFTTRGDYGIHVLQHSQDCKKFFEEDERYLVTVPKKSLTFMHDSGGEGFLYMLLNSENPPVHAFYSHMEHPDICADSFTAFIRNDIIWSLEEKRTVDAQIVSSNKFGHLSEEHKLWHSSFHEMEQIRNTDFSNRINTIETKEDRILGIQEFQSEWISYYYEQGLDDKFHIFKELDDYVPYDWTERHYEDMLG